MSVQESGFCSLSIEGNAVKLSTPTRVVGTKEGAGRVEDADDEDVDSAGTESQTFVEYEADDTIFDGDVDVDDVEGDCVVTRLDTGFITDWPMACRRSKMSAGIRSVGMRISAISFSCSRIVTT